MRKIWMALPSLLIVFFLTACGGDNAKTTSGEEEEASSAEQLEIYTTVYPLQFFAEQIAGEEALVESILPLDRTPIHTNRLRKK